MTPSKTHPIWPPDTGIADLSDQDRDIDCAAAMADLAGAWEGQQRLLQEAGMLRDFVQRMQREWALEAGLAARLYSMGRGMAAQLVRHGFDIGLLRPGATDQEPDLVLRLLRDQQAALLRVRLWGQDGGPLAAEPLSDEPLDAEPLAGEPPPAEPICQLHRLLTRHQREFCDGGLQGGQWKTQPNYVVRGRGLGMFCPPERVDGQMRLLLELHAEHQKQGVPAPVRAAWLHHRFAQIHPFADGNGRVGLALATAVLLAEGGLPFGVPRDDWDWHIRCLEAADRGDLEPLVELLLHEQGRLLRWAETEVLPLYQVQEDGGDGGDGGPGGHGWRRHGPDSLRDGDEDLDQHPDQGGDPWV